MKKVNIELKNVKVSEHLSEETTAFTADIFIDGVKAGYAKNSGQGGSTDYHPYEDKRDLIAKAEKYCETLPDIKFGENSMKMNLEYFIEDLLEAERTKKLEGKQMKKLEREMKDSILIGGKDRLGAYKKIKYGSPLATFAMSPAHKKQFQEILDKKKAELKAGEEIWNNNLEQLGFKI